jgi:hypothetical protein
MYYLQECFISQSSSYTVCFDSYLLISIFYYVSFEDDNPFLIGEDNLLLKSLEHSAARDSISSEHSYIAGKFCSTV